MAWRAAAVMLVTFGLMLGLVGGLLGGLCLIEGGIICSGTSIGDLASGFLWPGLAMLAAGLAVALLAPAPPRRQPEVLRAALAQQGVAFPAGAGPGRVASECPKCGGPVARRAAECEWCGTLLL